MKSGKRHVIFASDDRGFEPLLVAVYSLFSSADAARPLRVSVLTGCRPLTDEHRGILKRTAGKFANASLDIIDCDGLLASRLSAFADDAVCGRMAWARCLIGELFPNEHGNIVYLDIDTFVCCDLAELYDLDLGDNVLAAVPEERRETGRKHDPIWSNGLLDERAEFYCNSGVLVMNVDAFRNEGLLERICRWYVEHQKQLIRPDQDTLNSLFWNRIVHLHPRFNHCDGWLERQLKEDARAEFWRGNSQREVLEAIVNPAVLHFWGPKKPWHWNHRPEGARYARAMRELGVLQGSFPDATLGRRLAGWIFAVYHALLRRWVLLRLRRLTGEYMV